MNWFNRLFKEASSQVEAPSNSTGFYDMDGKPVPLNAQQSNPRLAREQIRAAAMRTAQSFGIPAPWLSYEVVTIADEEKAYFQLQVSLRFWDDQLWAQSTAFEQQVYKRIRADDVSVARALRAVLWRVLPEAGCPFDELSEAHAWKPEAVRARTQAYERLRRELSTPDQALGERIADARHAEADTASPSTQPMSLSAREQLEKQFKDSNASDFGGFAPTQPFNFDELRKKP